MNGLTVNKSQLWTLVRKSVFSDSTIRHNDDDWQEFYTALLSSANWNLICEDKKHPLTTDDEWKIINNRLKMPGAQEDMPGMQDGVPEEFYKEIFYILCEKRFEIFMNLLDLENK
jgi:hypothetical protein